MIRKERILYDVRGIVMGYAWLTPLFQTKVLPINRENTRVSTMMS